MIGNGMGSGLIHFRVNRLCLEFISGNTVEGDTHCQKERDAGLSTF